ncbi:S8 family serine peptidase [Baekduia sp. Peel2402]|uniref:S8 family serine peptidase n=1 Tax=Baekduia sp. Peel2402 TaxID=3458296 RepID=UPI00403EDD4C
MPSMLAAAALAAAAVALPGQVVVGFSDGASQEQRAAARASVDTINAQRLGEAETQTLTVPGASDATLAELREQPGVAYAEPAYQTAGDLIPPNLLFASQWPLFNTGQTGVADADLDAERAWDLVGSGASSVLVGLADSGVQPDHPAFQNLNVWTNPTAGSSGDSAGNGCVNDRHGCDTVTRGTKPFDENGHGTAAAGVIFSGWSLGIPYAGLAPASTLIPAKVLGTAGTGTTAQLAAGLNFLGDQGARVVNVSIGAPYSEAVHQAIVNHPNTLFVASAGNSGVNVDQAASYPCEDPAPNVICVAAIDSSDRLASFSNYGSSGVDLAAPGSAVPSTALGGGMGTFNGTSFAAPMVTGIAALAFAAKPSATVAEIKTNILWAVDGVADLTGKVSTGGAANAYNTVAHLLGVPVTPRPAKATGGAATAGATGTSGAVGSFTATTSTTTTAKTTTSGSTVMLRVSAHRAGTRKVHVTLQCVSAGGCTTRAIVAGGGATLRPALKLKRYRKQTLTLKVPSAALVQSVSVTVGSGKLAHRLTAPVKKA